MRYLELKVLTIVSACVVLIDARKWQDLIDRNLYLQPELDVARFQLKIELDPFYRYDGSEEAAPTAQPGAGSWVTKNPIPTSSPTLVPSDSPSLAPTGPTMAPTLRSENVEGNGGCHEGARLYRVNMYDLWGDGWSPETQLVITGVEDQDTVSINGSTVTKTHTSRQGGTTVSITKTIEMTSDHPFGVATSEEGQQHKYVYPLGKIFEGNLNRGSEGSAWVCLVPNRCYDVVVSGGDYLDEVSWEIEPVELGFGNETISDEPLAVQGKAPQTCSFSIPDEDGEYFCAASCSEPLPTDGNEPEKEELTIRKYLQPTQSKEHETFDFASRQSFNVDEAKRVGEDFFNMLREGHV